MKTLMTVYEKENEPRVMQVEGRVLPYLVLNTFDVVLAEVFQREDALKIACLLDETGCHAPHSVVYANEEMRKQLRANAGEPITFEYE